MDRLFQWMQNPELDPELRADIEHAWRVEMVESWYGFVPLWP